MASLQGYTDGSYDYKQMYNRKDRRGPLPLKAVDVNTILGFLKSNEFIFGNIIEQTDLKYKYSQGIADLTLFVPVNVGEWKNVRDSFKLKKLVLYHSLEKPLSGDFLKSSMGMRLNTRQPGSYILVENIKGQTILNRESVILDEVRVGNSNIFIIDRPLSLDGNPMVNIDI